MQARSIGSAASRHELARLRILVVEDNTYMRRIIRALLHGFGVREVLEAEDGAAGLESFAQNRPDLVITDWEMPILDGMEMAKIIRHPETSAKPDVPIIMVTSHSERRRVMEARECRISEFLVKPISTKALYDRVISAAFFPREQSLDDMAATSGEDADWAAALAAATDEKAA